MSNRFSRAAIVIALVALAGCGGHKSASSTTTTMASTTTAAPATTTTAAPATTTTTQPDPSKGVYGYATCAEAATNAKFVEAHSATNNGNGKVTVNGLSAHLVCGGPDDSHFEATTAPLSLTFPASGTMSALVTDDLAGNHNVTAAELPGIISSSTQPYWVIVGDTSNPISLYQAWHP